MDDSGTSKHYQEHILVIAQKELHDKARAALRDAEQVVTLVDPAELRTAYDRAIG